MLSDDLEVDAEIEMDTTEESFEKWLGLPTTVQTSVVSILDNNAKRSLRETCWHNYNSVNHFRFRNYTQHYYCFLKEEEMADGEMRYGVKQSFGEESYHTKTKDGFNYFRTLQGMVDHLQYSLKSVNNLQKFTLEVEGFTTPIQLMKYQGRLRVKNLSFEMNTEPIVVNNFLSQFDPDILETFMIDGENIGEQIFGAFEVGVSGTSASTIINDDQILRIRAQCVKILCAKSLTVFGLKQFLKKMLIEQTVAEFEWSDLSEELINLFDYEKSYEIAYISINPMYSDCSLMLELTQKPGESASPKLHGKIIPPDLVGCNFPIELGPGLQRFVESIEFDF